MATGSATTAVTIPIFRFLVICVLYELSAFYTQPTEMNR